MVNGILYNAVLIAVLVLLAAFALWIRKSWVGRQPDQAVASYRFSEAAAIMAIGCCLLFISFELGQLFYSENPPHHPVLEMLLPTFCIVCLLVSLRQQKRNLLLKEKQHSR
jgi:hypothetical protein